MVGTKLGHYRVLEELGHGGMGEGYLADDTNLDRKVALKFLPDAMEQDAVARKRLLREAKSAAALDHPYICKVYEIVESEGKTFIAMEHVEGETLADRLESGSLGTKQALKVAEEIAEALECAHKGRIIHRDLKPSNVMLSSDGHAKVLDFGLAKRGITETYDANHEATVTALTRQGTTMGTLPYMSPEQARGETVDARSDIFSFGIILYEMLTGVQPFRKGDPMDTAHAILHEEPPPVGRYVDDAPDVLEHIVRKLLAKDSADRYQLAHELRTDLAQLRRERPARRAFLPRHPVAAAGILSLLVAVVIGAWWVSKRYFVSPQEALAFTGRDWVLITDLDNLTDDPVFDHSLDTALAVSMQQSQYVNVFPRTRVKKTLQRMRREDVTELDASIGREIALREGIKALLVCSISRVGESYSLGMRLVDPDERSLPLPAATTSSLEALEVYADSMRLAAEGDSVTDDLLRRAVEIDPDFAMAHAQLGMKYYMSGEGSKGDEHFKQALNLMNRLTRREQLWISAIVEDWRGNRSQAIENYRLYLAQYPDDGAAWFRYGYANMISDRLKEATDAFGRVLELDGENAAAWVNLATCQGALQEYEDAVSNYKKSFELDPRLRTGDYVNSEYGFLLVGLGDFDEARETFELMLAQENQGLRARGHRSLALLDMYLGRYSEARASLEQAILLNQSSKSLVSEMRNRMYLAMIFKGLGMDAEFAEQVNAARRVQGEIRMGPEWLLPVGLAYARMGRVDEAGEILGEIEERLSDAAAASSVNRLRSREQAFPHLMRGEIELAQGDTDASLAALELAATFDDKRSREPLARCHFERGEIDAAIAKYEEVRADRRLGYEAQLKWIEAHYYLGRLYEQRGEQEKAVEAYEALLEIWSAADPDLMLAADARRRLE
jgi:serine/threonine protein kinase/tetratricopeptide (TPR) repeat protein